MLLRTSWGTQLLLQRSTGLSVGPASTPCLPRAEGFGIPGHQLAADINAWAMGAAVAHRQTLTSGDLELQSPVWS